MRITWNQVKMFVGQEDRIWQRDSCFRRQHVLVLTAPIKCEQLQILLLINISVDLWRDHTPAFTLYTFPDPPIPTFSPPPSHLHLYWIRSCGGERVEAAETDYNGRLWADCTTIMSCNYKERGGGGRRRRGGWDAYSQMPGSISFREIMPLCFPFHVFHL